MKLATTTTSERGKPMTKTGNEFIEIELFGDRETGRLAVLRLQVNEKYPDEYDLHIDETSSINIIEDEWICSECGKRKEEYDASLCDKCFTKEFNRVKKEEV